MSSFKMWHFMYSVLFDPRNKTLTKLATSTVYEKDQEKFRILTQEESGMLLTWNIEKQLLA